MYLASHRGDYLGAYRGDPGLFGSIGKFIGGAARVVGGIVPGPAGAIVGRIGRAISPSRPPPSTVPMPVGTARGIPSFRQIRGQVGRYEESGYRGSVDLPGVGVGAMGACPKGYRPNKSSYFTKDGQFHPAGSKCVKYRYRNVANGRALKRAISRTAAFDKMVKSNRKALRSLAKI